MLHLRVHVVIRACYVFSGARGQEVAVVFMLYDFTFICCICIYDPIVTYFCFLWCLCHPPLKAQISCNVFFLCFWVFPYYETFCSSKIFYWNYFFGFNFTCQFVMLVTDVHGKFLLCHFFVCSPINSCGKHKQ